MTLGRLIDRLEVAGWVERRRDSKDRRVRRLYLTAMARPTLSDIMKIATDMHDEALHGLSNDDLNQLMQTLLVIKNNLIEMNTMKNQTETVETPKLQMGAADD